MAATTATLVQEEEEREEQEVWEATQRAIYEAELDLDLDTCENRSRKRPRLLSLGNLNVPPGRSEPSLRFSSVGGGFGYNGLLKPPFRRFSAASFVSERYRRGSVGPLRKRSTSMDAPRVSSASCRMQTTSSSGDKQIYRRHKSGSDSDGDEADDEFEQITVTADINHQPSTFLSVPKVSFSCIEKTFLDSSHFTSHRDKIRDEVVASRVAVLKVHSSKDVAPQCPLELHRCQEFRVVRVSEMTLISKQVSTGHKQSYNNDHTHHTQPHISIRKSKLSKRHHEHPLI